MLGSSNRTKYDEGLPLKVVRTPFGYIGNKNEDHRFTNTQGQLTRPVVPDLLEGSKIIRDT